jgi:tetratricopeptide (TPR) repeat protein
MGQVFRARDTRLQRNVAIKILHNAGTGDARGRQRLLREARAAAALSHHGIVTIYAVEEVDEILFIVMELVEGVTLFDRIAPGPLSAAATCDIGAQVAEALAAAHAAGIVHHDITPRNILLTAGNRAKLVDFGLARILAPRHDTLDVTNSGRHVAGTAHYMSPEQTRGDPLTNRADLFSLGSVLYHAATGQRPFEGPTLHAVMHAIATHEPARPSAIRRDLPESFDAVIGRLLAKPLEARFVDASQVADLLRRLHAGLAPGQGVSEPPDERRATDHGSFVGRAKELDRLSAAMTRTAGGTGSVVVITGEAGMGKTTLVDEFLNHPDTLSSYALICRGQAVEHRGPGEAYLPIVDALAPVVVHPGSGLHDSLRAHAPAWCAQFPGAFPDAEVASHPPTQDRLARELGDALCVAATNRSIVLVIEDLHWADPSTIDLLRRLAHRTRRARLLIVATCRAEEAAATGSGLDEALLDLEARRVCDIIELTGLDEPQISHYLESRFGLEEISPPLASLLARATDGQPLFLVSLVQLFIERGDLRQVGGKWELATPLEHLHLGVPRTVQAVIKRKLSALHDDDQELLRWASVEGLEFSTAVLSKFVASDTLDLEDRLDQLSRASALILPIGPKRYPNGSWGARFRFAHAMYQHVVYGALGGTRRSNLHRQVADCLVALHGGETTAIAALLARHFKEGRDVERAFEHYMQAGDNAMTVSAGIEADAHYSDAVTLAMGEDSGVDSKRLVRAYAQRSIARSFIGKHDAAVSDLDCGVAGALTAGDADLVFNVRLARAYALALAGRSGEAAAAAKELKESINALPDGSKRLRQLTLDLQLHTGRGELDQAAVIADHAIALAHALGDRPKLLQVLSARAQLDFYASAYGSALPALKEVCGGATNANRASDPRPLDVLFHGRFFLGLTLGNLGRFSEALAALGTGLETARRDGYSYWVPRFLNGLGWLHGELGDLQTALRLDEEAVAASGRQDDEVRCQSWLNLATDNLRLGRLDDVGGLLNYTDRIAQQNRRLAWRSRIRSCCLAADYWLARGDVARAADLARQGALLARQAGAWKYIVLTSRTLAAAETECGRVADARAHLEAAVDLLSTHAVPLVAWQVQSRLGRLYEGSGEHDRASAMLGTARTEVRRLADNIAETALRISFLSSPAVRAVLDDEATVSDP